MKHQRAFSVLLVLCLLLGMMPAAALSANAKEPQSPQTAVTGQSGISDALEAGAPTPRKGLRSRGSGSARAGSYLLTVQALGENFAQYHDMKVVVKDADGHDLGVFDPAAYGAGNDGLDEWGVKVIPATFSASPASITITCYYQSTDWANYEKLTYTALFSECCVDETATVESRAQDPGTSVSFCRYSIECLENGAPVPYVDADGNNCIRESAVWFNGVIEESGWYVVRGAFTGNIIPIQGEDVNLVLCDGAVLDAKDGVRLSQGTSLTIWCQKGGSGKLSAIGYLVKGQYYDGSANQYSPGIYVPVGSSLTINGGTVVAKGQIKCAGIGGGIGLDFLPDSGAVTINAGIVEAYGGGSDLNTSGGGAGIGGGDRGTNGPITIRGGSGGGQTLVIAKGGAMGIGGNFLEENDDGHEDHDEFPLGTRYGAGLGSGGEGGTSGEIIIEGGTVEAVGGAGGAAIGGGYKCDSGPITISGGIVTAKACVSFGNEPGAAIGGGYFGKNGPITITGGEVTAETTNPRKPWADYISWSNHRNLAAAIGSGGNKDQGDKITISGGTVTAISHGVGAGIGGAADGGEIEIGGDDTVVVASSICGAGIGCGGEFPGVSGWLGDGFTGGSITINGGMVYGVSTYGGAGIGTGVLGHGGSITINGGIVTGCGGADHYSWYDETNRSGKIVGVISGGMGGGAFNVIFRTAKGMIEDLIIDWIFSDDYIGAGIGGGCLGDGGRIRINGGTVIAKGGSNAVSAIGNGLDSDKAVDLEIYDYSAVSYGNYHGSEPQLEGCTHNPPNTDRVDQVKQNTYAAIEPDDVAVSFEMGGHGTAPAAQTVLRGETATKPADPAADGWFFDGWYTDGTFSTPFDFTTPILTPVTIYAKWIRAFPCKVQLQWPDGADKPQSVSVRYQNRYSADGVRTGTLTLHDGNNWSGNVTLSESSVLTLTEQVPYGFFFGTGALEGISAVPKALSAAGDAVTLDLQTLSLSSAEKNALQSGSGILRLTNTKARIYSAHAEWDIPKANYKPASVSAVLQHFGGTAWETVETVELNETNAYTASFSPIPDTPGMDAYYRVRELDKDGSVVLSSTDEGGSASPTAALHICPWTNTEMDMDYQVSYAQNADGGTVVTNSAGKYFYVRIEWANIDDAADKPDEVNVHLLRDTALAASVTLSDENNWEAVFEGQMHDADYRIREQNEDFSTVYMTGDTRPSIDSQRPYDKAWYTVTRNGKTRIYAYDVSVVMNEDGRSAVITNTKSGVIYAARNIWNAPQDSPWPDRIFSVGAVLQHRTVDGGGNETWEDVETIDLSGDIAASTGKFRAIPLGSGYRDEDYRVREWIKNTDYSPYSSYPFRIDAETDTPDAAGRLLLALQDADNVTAQAPHFTVEVREWSTEITDWVYTRPTGYTASYARGADGSFLIINTEDGTDPVEVPLEHTWDAPSYAWSLSDETWRCTATRTCADDSTLTQTETVTAAYEVTAEPTCTEAGETTYTAAFENAVFEPQTQTLADIAPLGHIFTSYVYNNNATIDADGTETAICDHNCGLTDTRTAAGTRSVLDEISVTIDNGVGVNFLLGLDDPSRDGVQSITVTYKNFSGETVTETYAKSELIAQNGKYRLTVRIAPAQLADEITVTVGGTQLKQSVLGYCEELKDGDYAQKYKDVALALEQYAQAANAVFGYTADVIADISALRKDAVDAYTGAVFTDGTGKVTGASFMALTKPEFRFYTAGIDEQTAYNYNEAGVAATMAGGGDTLTARFVRKADGKGLLEVTGVSVENMDKTITVTITGLGTITFNGNAFAKAMASSGSTAQQHLGAALYNYGAAAKECFAA